VSGDSCLEPLASGTTALTNEWTSWSATAPSHRHDALAVIEARPNLVHRDSLPGWTVTVTVETPPVGLDRHWLARMELT
jgi:hypothetical protein